VIKEELCRQDVLLENVYNINKTGIILLMLDAVKVLVDKDNRRDYRGTSIKRMIVAAIKFVLVSGEYLYWMFIWPISTYRSN